MSGLYQNPYHFTQNANGSFKLTGGAKACESCSSCTVARPKVNQSGGGSDYQASFHAVAMNPRTLSLVTERYIDQSPMFNPLCQNTVIPTIHNGITPTGAYLLHELPTKPVQTKYYGDFARPALDSLCQTKKSLYDLIDNQLVPRADC